MAEVVAALKNVQLERNGQQILKGVSLEVTEGETVLITGESGSGKSTLLRMLAGIDRPDAGEVEIFGHPLPGKEKALRKLIAGQVGVGFQSPRVDDGRTVYQNLVTQAQLTARSGTEIVERAAHFAQAFGFEPHHLDRQAGSLSGGEKQRLSMVRMLGACPRLMLLDEPTSMIHPEGKSAFVDDLRAAVARDVGTTVLMVTHDREVERDFPHRQVVMDSGRIVSDQFFNPDVS
jgi:ABC-type multidrug transport system ATPase subunit